MATVWYAHDCDFLQARPSFSISLVDTLDIQSTLAFWAPFSPQEREFTYRFHQAAGAAMELSPWSSSLAGHGEGDWPGFPDHAVPPTTGRGLLRPGATVDGWEAAVEFLAGLGPLQS